MVKYDFSEWSKYEPTMRFFSSETIKQASSIIQERWLGAGNIQVVLKQQFPVFR